MHITLKKAKLFLILYFIFIVVGGLLLVLYDKTSIHLAFNNLHTNFLDYFFKYITFFGDGLIIIPLVVIYLFTRYRYAIILAVAYVSSGLFVQLFKRFFMPHCVRPVKYFDGLESLNLVEGVKVYGNHSFPSGHTATAFAVFLCLSLFVKAEKLKVLFFIIAFMVAISRVYLSQHFFIDVWAGSLFGVVFALLSYHFLINVKAKWMDKRILFCS